MAGNTQRRLTVDKEKSRPWISGAGGRDPDKLMKTEVRRKDLPAVELTSLK
jgi:hypothetical protein